MTEDPLASPLQFLRGVGPHRAELLAKLELRTVDDLLWYLPRDYLDLNDVRSASDLEAAKLQTVRGKVVDLDARSLSGNRTLSSVLIDCDGEYVRGVWFNQPWILSKFRPNDLVLFSGKPKRASGRWEIGNPRVQWLNEEDAPSGGGVLPVYGLTDGLNIQDLRRITRNAVDEFASLIPDPLTQEFREQNRIVPLADAIRQVHSPRSMAEQQQGQRTLVFHDLLDFQLALGMRRRLWQQRGHAPRLPVTTKIDSRIRRLFPYSLTAGQEQAIRDITADLASTRAMHRLLQADVGAGKTAIATYAMLTAIAAGYQTCLMAPTELLATQHWGTFDRMLRHSRVERGLLSGNLTASQRQAMLERIRSGTVQLIVGTQAIIQKDVEFAKLGLAVIDEQHKFGVSQRAKLSSGEEATHLLVMTATPIPRSLCLTQFGDLDLTIVTDLPPGRKKVVTSRVQSESTAQKAWEFIRGKLQNGRQLYVVCPRVETTGDDDYDEASVESMFRKLSQEDLSAFRVGLVHGRMDRQQKAAAMDAFRTGETQALVATTVVEVGVDVPNATLMVIYQAERFGLSQLHQLRGRIGRGNFQGYCFLFSDTEKDESVARLRAMENSANGFDIAEADFRLRGPGDVLGTRQHGDLPLRVADLVRDHKILEEARNAAQDLIATGTFDQPEFAALKRRVLERFHEQMELVSTG